MAKWEPMKPEEAPGVSEIAARIHPELPERTEVFADKIQRFPVGCRKAVMAGRWVGYALAHPWKRDAIPALDTLLGKLPDDADCLYIHDIALLPEARGLGLPGTYLAAMRDAARVRGFTSLAATSVYGTDVLWRRHGFTVRVVPVLTQKLAAYGPTAKYIVRAL